MELKNKRFEPIQKIHLTFLIIGVVMAGYGIFPVISIMTSFPEDVNMFAATMSLILLCLIVAGCMYGIIYILESRKEIKENQK